MPTSQLLWARFPLSRCPGCQSPLSFHDVTLDVHFEDQTVGFEIEVGHCRTSDMWLADLILVEDALEELELYLGDAEAFSVNDTLVDAAVWMGESTGAIPWEVHRQATKLSAEGRGEVPSLEAVRTLPQEEETWVLAQAASNLYLGEGEPSVGHIGLLVTEKGLVRRFLVHHEVLGVTELVRLTAEGCSVPPGGLRAVRPRAVRVSDPSVAEALGNELDDLGIEVTVGDVGPAVEALEALQGALEPEPVPSYFIHYAERDVKAFFKAAGGFFGAKPWEVFDGTKFLAFRIDEGPWRYANVMGQAEETYGIATFRDWLEVCKATNNPETMMDMLEALSGGERLPKSLLATGGAESLSLSSLDTLAPEDVVLLERLKIKPSWRKDYAAVQRFTPYGMETPLTDITLYTGLMTVLTERSRKVRGNQVTSLKATLDTPQGQMTIRYPAKGDEGASREDYYTFRIPFGLGARSETPGAYLQAEVGAPGEAKWHRVMAAVTKEAKAFPHIFPWVSEVMQGDYALWLDRAPVKEPSPTVAQLARQADLVLKMGLGERPPLHIERVARPEGAAIEVTFLSR